MFAYKPLSISVRIVAACGALVASALSLGGQLSLFAMVSNGASPSLAKAHIVPESRIVAEREARLARRS